MGDTAPVPDGSITDLRSATDHEIATFRTWLRGGAPEIEELYADALTALGRIGRVRLADVDYATEVFEFYDGRVDFLRSPLFNSGPRLTGDAALRQGPVLDGTARDQTAAITSLAETLTLAATTGGVDDTLEVTKVADLRTRFSDNADVIRDIDASSYGGQVERSFPRQLTADVLALAG